MQRTWTTHSDLAGSVVHDREGEQHHEGRDPVLACPAVFGPCPLAILTLLLVLAGLLHRSADLPS